MDDAFKELRIYRCEYGALRFETPHWRVTLGAQELRALVEARALGDWLRATHRGPAAQESEHEGGADGQ
jgi:hypothetical protein